MQPLHEHGVVDEGWFGCSARAPALKRLRCETQFLHNFLFFCGLFSVANATVAILAFTTAELGAKLGSDSGFLLYAFYFLPMGSVLVGAATEKKRPRKSTS